MLVTLTSPKGNKTQVDTDGDVFRVPEAPGWSQWMRIRPEVGAVRMIMSMICAERAEIRWEADVDMWAEFGNEIHAMRVKEGLKHGYRNPHYQW